MCCLSAISVVQFDGHVRLSRHFFSFDLEVLSQPDWTTAFDTIPFNS